MKFAYADPPYLGCSRLYDKHHAEARNWDNESAHVDLIKRLLREYPDGWAISLHVPSLSLYLTHCPQNIRVAAWVKPFASFKPNVTRAYTWEPVIFYGGRDIPKSDPTWRDHISEPITMRRGLTGAKPARVCAWILDGLGFKPGDALDDLFPGTGIMGEVAAARNGDDPQFGLFAEADA